MAKELQTLSNTTLNQIKRQSVSVDKAKKTLVDVYCIEIDINDYMVKEPDGSFTEDVITYTKQRPGGDEYKATLVKRFFKGYPYSCGTLTACDKDGNILTDAKGKPKEQIRVDGTIYEDEFLGQYSFIVQNDKSKANLYIEKVLYPNPDKSGEPIARYFAYIDVYETEYFDKTSNMNKTALNYQARVEFISDSRVTNLTNRINKRIAESKKFKAEVSIYNSDFMQKSKDGSNKLLSMKDLLKV